MIPLTLPSPEWAGVVVVASVVGAAVFRALWSLLVRGADA